MILDINISFVIILIIILRIINLYHMDLNLTNILFYNELIKI